MHGWWSVSVQYFMVHFFFSFAYYFHLFRAIRFFCIVFLHHPSPAGSPDTIVPQGGTVLKPRKAETQKYQGSTKVNQGQPIWSTLVNQRSTK
jgi:hypothetical protein